MLFHIEGNSKWASKFNRQLMKCHEKIENNDRSNFENEDVLMIDEELKSELESQSSLE